MKELAIEILNWWYPIGETFYITDSLIITCIIGIVSYLTHIGMESYNQGIMDVEDFIFMFIIKPLGWILGTFACWFLMPVVVVFLSISVFGLILSKLGKHNRNK